MTNMLTRKTSTSCTTPEKVTAAYEEAPDVAFFDESLDDVPS